MRFVVIDQNGHVSYRADEKNSDNDGPESFDGLDGALARVTDPKDDPATLAMLKTMSPMVDDQRYAYEGRDALDTEGSRDGDGGVRLHAGAADHCGGSAVNATPGDWVAKPRAIGGYTIFATDDILDDVIVGFANLNDQTLEQARDNARLFAAAKRMYAIVKGLNDYASPEARELILGAPLADEIRSIVESVEGQP